MNETNHRNIKVVEQALEDMYKKIEEQQIRIDGLSNGMSSLMERQNFLERMVYEMKVKLTGTGPTEI